ncbi:MAG: hypothetical protein AAFV33_07735 [Chloroflexota bacterium]
MTLKHEIHDLLEQSEPLTVYEIARCLDRKYSSYIRRSVETMVEMGVIKKAKRKSHNGRPAYVYSVVGKYRSLRAEWRAAVNMGNVLTYEMWLEQQLLKERDSYRG